MLTPQNLAGFGPEHDHQIVQAHITLKHSRFSFRQFVLLIARGQVADAFLFL